MKVCSNFHKIPPIVSIHIHINPVHNHSFYYLKKHINIFLLYKSSERSFFFRFSNQLTVLFVFPPFLQNVLRIVKGPSYIHSTRVGTLIVATIYLQLIQNRYMFRNFTVLQCSHQYCVQPAASDVEVVGYL